MLQGKLSVCQFLAVVVAIAGSVIGNKSTRFGTHTLFGNIRHCFEVTRHILWIIALTRGSLEIESARTGAVYHLAIPAHLVAIAVVRVLDEDTIRQDVAVAVRVHLIRTRKVPDAVLGPRIEVHSRVADAMLSLAILAVVIPVAGVRIRCESGGQSGAGIT